MTSKIELIFPTPIYINQDYKFTEEEKQIVISQEFRINRSNKSSRNDFLFEHPVLKNFKDYCTLHLKKFFQQTEEPLDPIEIFITSSWSNITEKNEGHHVHSHPNSIISGVFYVDVGEYDEINFVKSITAPQIDWNKKDNLFNALDWRYRVTNNTLLLFPSTLMHSVPTYKKQGKRISVAFNSFLRGELGNNIGKNRLRLDI